MPFVQSQYADQKPKQQETASPAAIASIPATTPIAEDPLTPAQIQEAIRIYRSVLSQSAPSSPVRQQAPPVEAERPPVHSNYYGGGPTDIPQSYLLNYSPSRAPAQSYVAPPPAQDVAEQQLLARLQAMQLEQQVAPPSPTPVHIEQVYTVPSRATPQKTRVAQRMYDDEESGYCFNRKKNSGEEQEEAPEAQIHTPIPAESYSAAQQQAYIHASPAAPVHQNYSKQAVSGPSEYIGMSNDNRFIYDAQKSLPAYNQNHSYTLVTAAPAVAHVRHEEPEEHHGTSTTEDVTQVPASPAVTSRFRGLIRNAQTPIQATAPIVVERVEHSAHPVNNNYGAFVPVNQMSLESEYQLPVLNDLASCIEHY